MPLVTQMGAAIRGRTAPNARTTTSAQTAIPQLQFADVRRRRSNIVVEGTVRIDAQGTNSAGDGNVQVQVGNMTIAHVQVANSVAAATAGVQEATAIAAIHGALVSSLGDGNSYSVTGTAG